MAQFARKVPFFRQAKDWRKRETVWVIRRNLASGKSGRSPGNEHLINSSGFSEKD